MRPPKAPTWVLDWYATEMNQAFATYDATRVGKAAEILRRNEGSEDFLYKAMCRSFRLEAKEVPLKAQRMRARKEDSREEESRGDTPGS
eukprot:12694724-Heterocapsa_arctica.AAC.1